MCEENYDFLIYLSYFRAGQDNVDLEVEMEIQAHL